MGSANQGRIQSSRELFGRVGILPRGSEFLLGPHSSASATVPLSSALGCVASPMLGVVSAVSGLCQSPGSYPDFEAFTATTAAVRYGRRLVESLVLRPSTQ